MISISILELSLLASFIGVSLTGDVPVVAPFSFPPALKEGERGSATCTIRSGDTPLEFQWLKDGQEAKDIEGIKIQSVMDSSFLVISSVSSKSSGNYTCIVRNAFGSDRYTSSLAVTAPPTWKTEPVDLFTKEGESEVIHCEASGVPPPEIKWAKGDSEKNSFISSDPSSSIKVLPSGSLSFSKIEATMQGSYTCIADNNFGMPLSKTILVKVREAPVLAPFSFTPALKEGERGNAACSVRSGDIPFEFKWFKDGKDLEEIDGIKIQSLTDSSVLSITSVSSKSSGNYTCVVKNAFGSDRYTSALAVTAPPTWKAEPTDLDTQEGENEVIHCEASGVPPPDIKWTYDSAEKGSIVTGDASSNIKILPNGALSLTKIEASMQGSYTCIADNKIGSPLLKTIFVKVREAPVVAPFYFPPGLKEGERGSAICTIKSGDRPFEFQWMKDGESVSESSNVKIQSVLDSSFLVIEAVTSESSGNYTCIVKNSYGSDRFVAALTVTAPPVWHKEPTDVVAQEGDSLTIDCTATGVPTPTIKWRSGGTENGYISNDSAAIIRVLTSGSLVISKVEASLKGLYTCEADNGFGKSLQKMISISVRDSPVVAPFIFPPGLKEGEQGSVTCTIRSGDRPAEFQWLKDGTEVTESSTVRIQSSGDYSILLIQSVVPESSGNYTCIVKNAYGSDRYTATLTVSAPPVWVKGPRDILVQEEDSVSLPCSAEGEPKPSIKWLRGVENTEIGSDSFPGMSVSPAGSLVIAKVQSSMQGSYTCVAENGLGKPLTQTITLSVRGK
ncbi:Hemicentin-2 [Araneus ventricosus]|uniref:Hemicentin-2 n=1 Tax=Araneus ventricosus TaxID=182803 RepID=A0A4Y2A9H4_ARAVE|nr:Hemicentin-2 [Araneus ventricosus]